MAAGRPLTTTFAPGAFRGLTIKGSTDPFVNLPPISGLVSSAALEEQARSQFGMMLALDEYRLRDTAPIPAPGDREGYYGPDHAGYWLSGLVDWLAVAAQGARYGLGPRLRYFELGCGSGRVVRHGAAHESGLDISCCDINKRHTEWVRLFLPGHIKVFHSTILPTLPLADNSIDLVPAFSVFTHIDDFETSWLLELRRILRPGGMAYLSIQSDRTWEECKQGWITAQLMPLAAQITEYQINEAFLAGPLPRERTVIWWPVEGDLYNATVFHAAEYIHREWGRLFAAVEIVPRGHFYQDVVLLRK